MKSAFQFGGIWPVAQRELREAARRKGNRRMRFWGALAGTALLWCLVANSDEPEKEMGFTLFLSLHAMLVGLILVIAPCLTADCIAREKREGTLGLLFLTPLTAGGVVGGKAATGTLRAFTLWLAMLPVLMVPFLTGGITWLDAFSAVSIEFCATVLCLAAGLLASSLVQNRNAAFSLGLILAAFFVYIFSDVVFIALVCVTHGLSLPDLLEHLMYEPWDLLTFNPGLLLNTLYSGPPLTLWNVIAFGAVSVSLWTRVCLACPPAALLVFGLIFRFAARRVEHSRQDKVPSPRHERLLQRYCTPIFQNRFRRSMQRSLDWNPIAWLQQYSWKARVTKWGLCLAFIFVQWVVLRFPDNRDTRDAIQWLLIIGLSGIYLFVGVNSFLEEKRNGALELLLVTPISVNMIIFGRAWGLCKQFLPAALVIATFITSGSSGWYADTDYSPWHDPILQTFLVCVFLTLPIFATYAALRLKNPFGAAGLALIAALVPMAFAESAAGIVLDGDSPGDNAAFMILVVSFYVAFAGLTCFLLRHSLSRRIYSF